MISGSCVQDTGYNICFNIFLNKSIQPWWGDFFKKNIYIYCSPNLWTKISLKFDCFLIFPNSLSLFFLLCRDGEAILEIRGTLPLAGPGADLEMDEEWSMERWQYGMEIREKERRTRLYHFFFVSWFKILHMFGSCEACRKHQSLTISILDNWYIRLMANNCFRALKQQAKSLTSAFVKWIFAQCWVRIKHTQNSVSYVSECLHWCEVWALWGWGLAEAVSGTLWNKKHCNLDGKILEDFVIKSVIKNPQLYGQKYSRS